MTEKYEILTCVLNSGCTVHYGKLTLWYVDIAVVDIAVVDITDFFGLFRFSCKVLGSRYSCIKNIFLFYTKNSIIYSNI